MTAVARLRAAAESVPDHAFPVDRALAAAVLALLDAPDLAEEGWAYASDYFRDKWEYAERMAEMRRALAEAAAMLPEEGEEDA